MRLTGISNGGLLLIATLVTILWGIIFAERTIVSQAHRETLRVLRSRERVPVKYQKQQFRSAPVPPLAG